jgi:periplasmic glucans biosynthesis protein
MNAKKFVIDRRRFIGLLGATALAPLGYGVFDRAWAAPAQALGPPQPFDFDWLKAKAQTLAGKPFVEPPVRSALLQSINYDVHQKIRFRPEMNLLADGTSFYSIQLFHLGRYIQSPVTIYLVKDGTAREVIYSPTYFDYGGTGLDNKLPADLGFAGFRVMTGPNEPKPGEWLVFLGASYFRSDGELKQYGLSARGIAVDTAVPGPEEFPRFTRFWLQPTGKNKDIMTIHALLEGNSLTGAYRFDCRRETGVIMDVEAVLFVRRDIERLGIAPLTSMFWFGENNRHVATDWRPEIHDSDGLAIWTGLGERIWRPLNNPDVPRTSAFTDENPKGFGLMQRDREFANYQDDGAFSDRRPSVWVEPLGPWGKGSVQLVELPTDDEIHDNIVAFWVSAEPVKAGARLSHRYRLHWLADEPYPMAQLGRTISTRIGRGGIPGQVRPAGSRTFVIDFAGGPVETLETQDKVVAVVTHSRGKITKVGAIRVGDTKIWRTFFDLQADGVEPVDLRCFLRLGDQPLTETWLYQYLPFRYPGDAPDKRAQISAP